MAEADAFTITIGVPTGQPGGLRVIEMPNWSGTGFMFPRDDWRQEDIQRQGAMGNPGVYILWGDNDDGEQRIYIGEADSVSDRLQTHVSKREHQFWNETIVFVSKDTSVTKAHVLFVESELVRIAKQVDPKKVANIQNPGKPNLSENDAITASSFLRRSLACMEIVGIPFFKETRAGSQVSETLLPEEAGASITPLTEREILYLRGGAGRREADATGYRDGKELVVLAGARAAKEEVPSASEAIRMSRSMLVNEGHLVDRGDHYELVNEFRFGSPSAAAQAFLGRASNGRNEWKNEAGIVLNDLL